jgi:hypothetical protein
MSDEFDNDEDNDYSSFWPLLILVSGLLIWFAFQDYELNFQRSAYDKQFQSELTTISEAQTIENKYVALMNDLYQTSAKDPVAAQIVKDAIQAGWVHVQPNAANSTATPADSTPSK